MRAGAGDHRVERAACAAAVSSAVLAEATFAIGELAGEFHITMRTLRFYEARGLLSPRRDGSERRYSQDDRRRVAFILQAKQLGFTLREIRDLMASEDGAPGGLQLSRRQCTEQINLLERQKRTIEAALAALRRVYSDHYLHALAHGEAGDG